MIEIPKVCAVTGVGKRQNNEDTQGYDESAGIFIVCDGVGGVEKGEVASEITVKSLLNILIKRSDVSIEHAVVETEERLSEYIQQHPETMGMATTLTLTRIHSDSIEVAWIGDSRVYQFRQGSIIYRTDDHSWVNEAVKAGILSPEEAIDHPRSNIITRALQGSHKPVKADVDMIRNIQPGDFILQCSDGVLETWDDNDLAALFNSTSDIQSIVDRLSAECSEHSRDNYTAILYQIGEIKIIDQSSFRKQTVSENINDAKANHAPTDSIHCREEHRNLANTDTIQHDKKSMRGNSFFNFKNLRLSRIFFLIGIFLIPLFFWLGYQIILDSSTERDTLEINTRKVKNEYESGNEINNSVNDSSKNNEKKEGNIGRDDDTSINDVLKNKQIKFDSSRESSKKILKNNN